MTVKTLTACGIAALLMVLPAVRAEDARAARVRVPVDRSSPAAGHLSLYVRTIPATGRRTGTLLYLAGGPGSAATREVGAVLAPLGRGIRRHRAVVAFDARGTGRSWPLSCPALQRDTTLRSTAKAAQCAARLGARRGTVTVDEQVADIESVRRALHVRRLDLLGISYGTEVAQRYAQAHPDRVGRIVLDSVLGAEGPSALGLEVFSGMPRVLRTLCARRRCPGSVPAPDATVPAVVRQLRAAPLRATVFDARGRARARVIDPVRLLDLLLAGDFSPGLRLALPAALAAAQRGDGAPLARLAELDRRASPPPRLRDFSVAQYAATSCESLAFPWDPGAPPDVRRQQAAAEIARLGDAPFAPFDGQTMLDADFLPLCLAWPAPVHAAQPVPASLPPVPMLVLSGEEDLRTPVESARTAAQRDPRARLLVVPGVGHSVMSADDSGCATRAVRAFLAGRRGPARCAGPRPYLPPVRTAPASLGELGPGATPVQRARRTLRAVDRTLDDVVLALTVGTSAGGGLRGGSYADGRRGLVLRAYQLVPGVRVDARPRPGRAERLRVRPAPGVAAGTLLLRRSGRFTGRLGGRTVRGTLGGGAPSA